MSNIIASRTLYDVRDPDRKFIIEIDSPTVQGSTYWHCEVRLNGAPAGSDKMTAGGNDSYQALTSALAMIQAMVNSLNAGALNGNLRFLEDADLDLYLKVIQD